LRRRPSKAMAVRNEAIVLWLGELKSEHPFWGYHRCWAYLRHVDKLEVNKKLAYRLLKEHGLLATQTKHGVPRTSTRSKPKPDKLNQWWGIDMTKVMTESGWAYVVLVLDWYSKKVGGHHRGKTATSGE
jgi:putative transposase